ncbi:DNA polymerase III subunit gamma/tau [Candidatus Vidania fulgoroideorum]
MDFYNKYKPQKIKDFFGQKHILKTVKYFKKKSFFPNSIIFYGKKGTGKTSFSRIFFKYINCLKKKDICECCEFCKVNIENNTDYIEIDAASNSKVDDLKSILENFSYLPIYSFYKVICIDEAHMLSIFSFNYLLKFIENIQDKFILIFITTNVKKIPDTIKSRCFIFNFKIFSIYEIFIYLKKISKKEKIKITKNSLISIAQNSYGSLRDSLVLLQHSHILSNGKLIESKTIDNILDLPKEKHLFDFLKYLVKYDFYNLEILCINLIKKKTNIKKFIKKIFEITFIYIIEIENKKLLNKKYFFFYLNKKKLLNKKNIKIFKIIFNVIKKEIRFIKYFVNEYLLIKYILFCITNKMPKVGLEPTSN